MKRTLIIILIIVMCSAMLLGCDSNEPESTTTPEYQSSHTPSLSDEEIDTAINELLAKMSIEEKAAQMVQGEMQSVSPDSVATYGLGSVLSGGGSVPGNGTKKDWVEHVNSLQNAALSRDIQIPIIYGIDAVHGNALLENTILFPHSIGLGAANDPKLMEKMGEIVAQEMKATGVHWNFGPCVACALDPRWGRTYESISSNPELTTRISAPFASALQENGIIACAKHYIGDGGTTYGTGKQYQIDQGDVQITEQELLDAFLPPYKQLIDDGVYTVMASFSSFNGLKMHQHEYLLTDLLKGELGFQGFVVSDWEGHDQIDAPSYNEKVAITINSGIDMLMEPYKWIDSIEAILIGVENGSISSERIDDAVYRILWVKFKIGLFSNPYPDTDYEIRSAKNLEIAVELVEKSCVLLKNDNELLPIADKSKVFITGPAMDNVGVQCGGWTKTWQGTIDGKNKVTEGTTLLEGLVALAEEKGIEIITDEDRIGEADLVIIVIGEKPYAEGVGDSNNISLLGNTSLVGNKDAMLLAKNSNLPTITVIMAGRNVIINDYLDDWDAIVMAYLPGTEGQGIANLLLGEASFTGKLSMPWYETVADIGKNEPNLLFEFGFGLETK